MAKERDVWVRHACGHERKVTLEGSAKVQLIAKNIQNLMVCPDCLRIRSEAATRQSALNAIETAEKRLRRAVDYYGKAGILLTQPRMNLEDKRHGLSWKRRAGLLVALLDGDADNLDEICHWITDITRRAFGKVPKHPIEVPCEPEIDDTPRVHCQRCGRELAADESECGCFEAEQEAL